MPSKLKMYLIADGYTLFGFKNGKMQTMIEIKKKVISPGVNCFLFGYFING